MTFDEYQQKALTTAKDEDLELIHRAMGLAGEAGEVANKFTKWLRDHKGDVSQLDKPAIAKELGDTLWFVATLADALGYKFEDIARQNLEKLASRDARDLIRGSGDNR